MPYSKVATDPPVRASNGATITPVATLADEHGGRCQIAVDDHCYVLYLKNDADTYRLTHHIFREAFDVLRQLPAPH